MSSSASGVAVMTDLPTRHHPPRRTGQSNDARTGEKSPSPSRRARPASPTHGPDEPADGDHATSNERYGETRRPRGLWRRQSPQHRRSSLHVNPTPTSRPSTASARSPSTVTAALPVFAPVVVTRERYRPRTDVIGEAT